MQSREADDCAVDTAACAALAPFGIRTGIQVQRVGSAATTVTYGALVSARWRDYVYSAYETLSVPTATHHEEGSSAFHRVRRVLPQSVQEASEG